jgi:ABC-2 type transport system ATP-binding protein
MDVILRKLQRESFVLSLREPLGTAPVLDGFEVERAGEYELEVAVDAEHDLNELFELLNAQGIRVISLRNKANRLEELFLGLIEGRQVSPGAAETPS